jgi:hypothetical protein
MDMERIYGFKSMKSEVRMIGSIITSIKLFIYGSTALVDLGRFFSF